MCTNNFFLFLVFQCEVNSHDYAYMTLNAQIKFLFRSRAIMNTYFFFGSFFFSFFGRKDENIGDNPLLRKSDNVSQLPFSVFIFTF